MTKKESLFKPNALTIIGLIGSFVTAYISKENIPVVVGISLIILVANVLDSITDEIEKNSERIKKNEERLNIYKELMNIKIDIKNIKKEVFKK